MAWPTIIDDDGTGMTGTVLNKALFDAMQGEIIANDRLTVYSNTSTGTVNDAFPVGMGTSQSLCQWIGAADVQWTGLAGGAAGMQFTFRNGTATRVATFPNASVASAASARFNNIVTSTATIIAPGGWITWVHSGSSWICVGYEQGQYAAVPFSAANFFAPGSMTWTVNAGNVASNWAFLSGKRLLWEFSMSGPVLGGTAGNVLHATFPFGLTNAQPFLALVKCGEFGSIFGHGEAYTDGVGQTYMQIAKANFSNWVLGAMPMLKVQIEVPIA